MSKKKNHQHFFIYLFSLNYWKVLLKKYILYIKKNNIIQKLKNLKKSKICKPKKIIKKFIIFAFIIFNITVLYLYFFVFLKLPNLDIITDYNPVVTTKFFDRKNRLIFEIGDEKRVFIEEEKIPLILKQAFIAAEDKSFYKNYGIDIIGLAKLPFINIVKLITGERFVGASTITQQVIKNIALTNERTITRKIKEMLLAIKITKELPKNKIMEIYLNHLYLGMQSYGIVSASKIYFDKNLDELSISEMALLAALPKAPSSINPFKNKARAISRRNWVLKRMLDEGFIHYTEYEKYIKDNIILNENIKSDNFFGFYAPVFFAISNIINSDIGINEKILYKQGINVKLTIDKDLQIIAQDTFDKGMIFYTKMHGFSGPLYHFNFNEQQIENLDELWSEVDMPENIGHFMLAIVTNVDNEKVEILLPNNDTGIIKFQNMSWARKKISETETGPDIKSCDEVLEIGDVIVVDNLKDEDGHIIETNYSLEEIPEINGGMVVLDSSNSAIIAMVGGYLDKPGSFNRAYQAFRQVGSTIKPFVYLAALENGTKPTDVFMDNEISMNLGDGVIWSPQNHTKQYTGPVTLRMGLEKSLNTVTVRLANYTKIHKIQNIIREFGINLNPEPNLSIALGSVESKLLSIVNGFAAIANNGILTNVHIVENIINVNNQELYNKIYLNHYDFQPLNNIENITQNIQDNDNLMNENEKHISEYNKLFQTKVSSKESAYQILNMLEGAVKRGTSRRLEDLNLPIASKTGTSDHGRDLWNIVMTPEIVSGVYIGYDIPKDTENYGAGYALPINKIFFTKIRDDINFTVFKSPSNMKYVKINWSTGKRTNDKFNDKSVIYEVLKENDMMPDMEYYETGNKSLDLGELENLM